MIESGAAGVRLDGVEHVRATRECVSAPIIGINKQRSDSFAIYITPTVAAALDVVQAGANIVALDGADGPRPDGSNVAVLVREVHEAGALVMADISTFDEGLAAADAGADIVATTLSGYTPYSRRPDGPDVALVERLAEHLDLPIIAEGRYNTPILMRRAFEAGAHAVVVGRAITEPRFIVTGFLEAAPAGGSPG